jgi:hypothetical protein
MSYLTWKIEHTPFVNNAWNPASTTEITSFHSPLLEMQLGDGRDNFKFKLTNFNNEYTNMFNPNDKIVISRVSNSSTVTTDNILMVGAIKDVPYTSQPTDNTLNIQGYNYSETVMSAITFVDAENMNIIEALQAGLNQVGNDNPNFKVTWDSGNPTTTTTGGTFPTIGKRFFYKPLRDIIEKYSTKSETGDVSYFWYVNNDNKLIWRPANDPLFQTYTFDSTTDIHTSLKVSKDIKGVRNFIIMKGGVGPDNKQIQAVYRDYSSIAKHGNKFQIVVSETQTAKQLAKLDIGDTETTDSYPDLTSNINTKWLASITATVTSGSNSASMVDGSVVAINASTEDERKKLYAKVIKEEVKARLKAEAVLYVEARRYGKLQVEINVAAGSKDWVLGDKITCNILEIQTLNKVLRVAQIQYGNDTDSYILEEDEGSL